MPRWAYICQQCWDVLNGDQYFPSPREYSDEPCGVCGEQALTVAVHPDLVEATLEVVTPNCTGNPEFPTYEETRS